ncbi:MAG TPA: hypothetical protein VM737_12390 [Gemmatimonadota bacterium]|nr:hypothetical protein [Gemmatimonadota bacterium]
MNRTRAFSVLALLLVATARGAGPAAAQSVGQQEVGVSLQGPTVAVPASLQDIYRKLAAAWESEDSRAIAHLAREGRVYVVVQREGIGERLAASQLQYLLEDLFDTTEELEFRFPAYSAYDPEAGTGYAVGERLYNQGPGIELSDRVFVGARNEHGRWVLTELRLTFE